MLAACLPWAEVACAAEGGRLINKPFQNAYPVELREGDVFVYDGQRYPLDDHHFLVDMTVGNSDAGLYPFVFNNFKDAMTHITDGTEDNPMVVYVAPGVYWVDDPDNPEVKVGEDGKVPFGMVVRCQNLHLVGLSHDSRDVVLASQRGQTQGAIGNFTMFDFHGDGLQVSHLTMGNFCNVDLEFPLMPSLGRKKRSSAITQAHVAYCHGDKVVASNVRFVSRLNMNPLNGAKRILFDHCHMECTDDALTGNGVYLSCDFEFYGQKPFYTTSRFGAVMLDCDFHLKSNNTESYFCKASGPLTLIDCRFHASSPVYVGWTAYPAPWLRCYYSNVTFNGAPYLVEAKHPQTSVCLDGKPLLKAFKNEDGYCVNNLLAGDDGWAPYAGNPSSSMPPQCTSLLVQPNQVSLTGDGRKMTFKADLRRHSGYASIQKNIIRWEVQKEYEKFLRIVTSDNDSCVVVADSDEDIPVEVILSAHTDEGLVGVANIHLEGKPLPPPTLCFPPKIRIADGVATLDYALSPSSHGDASDITWYQTTKRNSDDAIVVAQSHGAPLRTYRLKEGDKGKYLAAAIVPNHLRSHGDSVVWAFSKKIRRAGRQQEVRSVETDFSDFPCSWQPRVAEGIWIVDGFKPNDTAEFPWSFDGKRPMWEYGEGFNGAKGKGLLQAQRGARIRYAPVGEKFGDMTVTLDVDPTKTAGQGFGSATGQYMDVCLKFDIRSLSGYALRIIRTTKYAKAVDFQLMRYENGRTTPIGVPLSAVCYRTGCHIVVSVRGNQLEAHVTTSTPLDPPEDPHLKTEVHLSAQIQPNDWGGFCLQHTGSCGESTTMLHHLRMEWR